MPHKFDGLRVSEILRTKKGSVKSAPPIQATLSRALNPASLPVPLVNVHRPAGVGSDQSNMQ